MKELTTRKNMRLEGYDYSQTGFYFITMCVKDGHEMLGNIVNGIPHVSLSQYGVILQANITSINTHYDNISIQQYVIMPNHVHLLIKVHNKENGTSRTPSPTNAVVPSLISTLKRFFHKECGFAIFQRSYHDHIIRNEIEYQKIWQYIGNNPAKWEEDCYFKPKGDII